MLPIPFGILILKDYGDCKVDDFYLGPSEGRNLLLKGPPQTFVNWLKQFGQIWVSEDMNPDSGFMLAHIKS